MPLTTVAQGRVYEWSHAVGRGAQSGTGFNYPQTMCLAKGGVAFVLGEKVKGGHYGEMPSLKAEHLVQGDLNPNMDFRSVYSTILEKHLGLNPAPIVNGTFEQPAFLN